MDPALKRLAYGTMTVLTLAACGRAGVPPRVQEGPSTSGSSGNHEVQASPSVLPTDDPVYGGLERSINWRSPLGGAALHVDMSTASQYLAFAPVPPPSDLGDAAYLAITDPEAAPRPNRAIAWVFAIDSAPVDIVEQPATETITELQDSIKCRVGDVECVSAGRGTTTLADGSNAVWIHYPFGTSVEWINSLGVDIVVKGPFDELPLDTAMSVANSMASPD